MMDRVGELLVLGIAGYTLFLIVGVTYSVLSTLATI